MPYLAARAGINAIAPVKRGAIQGTRDLSEGVLIQCPSDLYTVLRHQTSGIGLCHGVIHTLRVTRHETREDLLRGWTIRRLSHHRRLPLTWPHEMGRSTAEGVTKQRQGRDDEPYYVSRNFVL